MIKVLFGVMNRVVVRMSLKTRRSHTSGLVWWTMVIVALPLILFASVAQAEIADTSGRARQLDERCGTQLAYNLKYPMTDRSDGRCPAQGLCDDPTERDDWIPAEDDPIQTVLVYFNVFAENDGSNPVVTPDDLQAAVDGLNPRFLAHRFQFEYDYRIVNDSRYVDLDGFDEFAQAKAEYAFDPELQCNVFVSYVHDGDWWFSWGTYPWDPDALTALGGILMHPLHMPPNDHITLSHEMGHALGLYHTHYGTDEVTMCGQCYEGPATEDRDYKGDLCSDTYPTYLYGGCGPAPGVDPCSGLPWGPGEPDNIMSYSPEECRDEFTLQQSGRMKCWTKTVLSGWLEPVSIVTDTSEGPAPLEISFSGMTEKTVDDWSWEFGDGGYSDQASPVHIYQDPGLYNVSVTIETPEGSFIRKANELIWAQGDTLSIPTVVNILGRPTRFDVYARNSLPLKELWIPFSWAGGLDVQFDSVTTNGLRTEFMPNKQLIQLSPANQRGTFRFTYGGGDELSVGTGAVLSIWLTCVSGSSGETSPVTVTSYGNYEPRYVARRTEFAPMLAHGAFQVCLPGDVNGDGAGPFIDDLVYLVDFMFNDGDVPPVLMQTDIDGSGSMDIADLVYLVDYMFTGGPPPVGCG